MAETINESNKIIGGRINSYVYKEWTAWGSVHQSGIDYSKFLITFGDLRNQLENDIV